MRHTPRTDAEISKNCRYIAPIATGAITGCANVPPVPLETTVMMTGIEPMVPASFTQQLERENIALVEALEAAQRLIKEALPKFNWGASALDANAIRLLNETPKIVNDALLLAKAGRV